MVVSRDPLLRWVKAQGATVVAQKLQRRDVKVLATDDVHLRAGDASTACSVFIDGRPRRFLVMIEGARQDTGAYALSVMVRVRPWRWVLNAIWRFALSLHGFPAICRDLYVPMNSAWQRRWAKMDQARMAVSGRITQNAQEPNRGSFVYEHYREGRMRRPAKVPLL